MLLTKPVPGELLVLYLAMGEESISTVLVREDEGMQKPVYIVSKVLHGPESSYSEIEKAAFAVMITTRKLRPSFLSHQVKVRTHFPFQKTLGRPDFSGQMVKRAV